VKLAHFWILHFLWLLPVVGVALIVCNRQKKKAMDRFADPELIARLTGEERKSGRFFKGVFLLSALGLMLFALAGPRWGSHYQEVSQKGVDIMILVDVSPSMLVEDVKPNRLERARREILDFLKVVQGDRLGLAAFSGAAFVQCPLILDYAALEMFLSQLQPDLIPVPGTDLGAAIETGSSAIDLKSETDRVILLITDGEDNEARGLEAARTAAEKGVKIFVFGIGEPSGGPIPAGPGKGGFKKDKEGKLILSKLDEESLRQIAFTTGGTYARSVAGDLDLDVLYFDGIKSRTKAQTLKSGKIKVYEERFPIFVLAAFLLLMLENLIPERSIHPKNMILTVISIIFPLLFEVISPTGAMAADNPDELYDQGRFAEAEKAYAASDMDHPKDIRYRYNRGCAAYQNAGYRGAAAAFASALRRAQDSETRFKAVYNLGNTAFKQGDLASAVAHYKKALMYRPNSTEAKYNLELALRQLEKQKQSKGEGQKKPSDKDSRQPEKNGDQSQDKKPAKGPDKSCGETKMPDQPSSQAKNQGKNEGQGQSGPEQQPPQPKEAKPGGSQKVEQDSAKDLSGDLELMQGLPEEKGHDQQAQGSVMSMIDKKKAEALLDNIKEDRSRFLRFQVPQDRRQGVPSGKNW
jgi:Ca-activated chloride channel family protein